MTAVIMNSKWDDLREDYLPEAFVKKGFIRQGKKPMPYNPEDYLREMINESSFFINKTGGEKFHEPMVL